MKQRLLTRGNPEKWTAGWIDAETGRPWLEIVPIHGQERNPNPNARARKIEHRKGASYLKKTFPLLNVPKEACLCATSHGIYDIWINKNHVDGFLLAPLTSQYNRRLMVQCYEIADLLKEGENEILVSLGDGWYRGCVGNSQDINTFGDDLAFFCEIQADGKVLTVTDESWLAAQDGPLGQSDMMRGEYYDARITDADMHWHPVTCRDYSTENLIPTDCPTREKSGFTGDAQVFCETALTLMDSKPVFRHWLRDLAASAEPGVFRQVAPDARKPGYFENSAGWCDAMVLVPWRIWKRTGDAGIITENYGAMKAWLDFCIERAKETRPENENRLPKDLLPYFADMGFCWGEWLEPGSNSMQETMEHMRHGEPEAATAYLSYSCRAFAEMAAIIGCEEDAA